MVALWSANKIFLESYYLAATSVCALYIIAALQGYPFLLQIFKGSDLLLCTSHRIACSSWQQNSTDVYAYIQMESYKYGLKWMWSNGLLLKVFENSVSLNYLIIKAHYYTFAPKERVSWLFTVSCPAQEFFTYMETSPLPVKGCKI
jgi:hypothetical protein